MVLRKIENVRSAVARRARVRLRRIRARASGARRPVILMYHRIAHETFDPWGLAVAPDKFAEQLSWLAKHRALMSLPEFAGLHRRGALPDDAVAITFDDGYACTGEVAAPLLESYGIPATIFIPAALIGRARPFWWDELRQIVMTHPDTSLHARDRTFGLGERQTRDAIWPRDSRKRTPRQNAFYALWSELQPLTLDEIEQTLVEFRAKHAPATTETGSRLMTGDEVRSIRSDMIQFGSHALTHVSLPGLTGPEKAAEIRNSIAACEELVGTRPVSFAYPFGDFDAECEALVAEAGFACACTAEPRAISADEDIFALPRLRVGNWTWRQLRQELADLSYHPEAA
jgi:peptidoglycan/xylan/chitin deacetylase (PgdA/CDA1 family)